MGTQPSGEENLLQGHDAEDGIESHAWAVSHLRKGPSRTRQSDVTMKADDVSTYGVEKGPRISVVMR